MNNVMPLDRRTFLRGLLCVPPNLASLSVLSRVGLCGNLPSNRPFEILAIGDSVVWGQGLAHKDKFTEQVRTWLECEKFGGSREVNLHYLESHSGARILDHSARPTRRLYNEINDPAPSIIEQVDNAATFYLGRKVPGPLPTGNVDLIILDGGINDMRAESIIFSEPQAIKKAAHDYCYRAMIDKLLPAVIKTFPNANIVITGYFRLFSEETKPEKISRTVLEVLKLGALGGIAEWALKLGDKKMVIKKLSLGSQVWYDSSNFELNRAAEDANRLLLPGHQKFSAKNRRVTFVQPRFEPINAYGADEPWLWELEKGKSVDEMKDIRKEACRVRKGFDKFICRRASTFHPNKLGASKYAESIKEALKEVFPYTGWLSE